MLLSKCLIRRRCRCRAIKLLSLPFCCYCPFHNNHTPKWIYCLIVFWLGGKQKDTSQTDKYYCLISRLGAFSISQITSPVEFYKICYRKIRISPEMLLNFKKKLNIWLKCVSYLFWWSCTDFSRTKFTEAFIVILFRIFISLDILFALNICSLKEIFHGQSDR